MIRFVSLYVAKNWKSLKSKQLVDKNEAAGIQFLPENKS